VARIIAIGRFVLRPNRSENSAFSPAGGRVVEFARHFADLENVGQGVEQAIEDFEPRGKIPKSGIRYDNQADVTPYFCPRASCAAASSPKRADSRQKPSNPAGVTMISALEIDVVGLA